MLKEMLGSGAAKLVAACVCPVVGTAALTVSVPKVRSAVHRMTAPPERSAKAKPRLRQPVKRAAPPEESNCAAPAAGSAALQIAMPLVSPDLTGMQSGLGNANVQAGSARMVAEAAFAAPLTGGRLGFGGRGSGAMPGTIPVSDADGSEDKPGQTVPPPSAELSTGTSPVTPVPEPATWAQMLLGFGMLGLITRARSRKLKQAALR